MVSSLIKSGQSFSHRGGDLISRHHKGSSQASKSGAHNNAFLLFVECSCANLCGREVCGKKKWGTSQGSALAPGKTTHAGKAALKFPANNSRADRLVFDLTPSHSLQIHSVGCDIEVLKDLFFASTPLRNISIDILSL
jgi:hypothetical protein